MELTAENVTNLFAKCCMDHLNSQMVEGIISKAHLNTAGHESEIADMLHQLPTQFQQHQGGGWTFLNACQRSDGELWTGLQSTVEKLVMLGIATGKVKIQFPREIWDVLPGGVPYFVVEGGT